MSNLSTLIDNMANPVIDDFFSETDRRAILAVIAASKQRSRPYSGDFKAPWLLSDFKAPIWITTNRNREEMIDGIWRNSVNIYWGIRLPNGALLTDPEYHKLLDLNQRIAFLMRSGHVSEITAPKTWRAHVSVLLQLTRWTVLYQSQFHPHRFGFKLLDQFAFDSLLLAHAEGGWAVAQKLPQRLLSKFYRGAFGKPCPQHLLESAYEIPTPVRTKITTWLIENSYYGIVDHGVNTGRAYLLRERLADELHEPVESMNTSQKLNAFCRQFEPDFQIGELLVNIHQKTEFPDHKTKTIRETISNRSAEATLDWISGALAPVLSTHRHAPDLLPEPASISLRRAYAQALPLTRQSGHSPFIPIDIGLSYFNHAMRFVHVYGDALIDFYLKVLSSAPKPFGGVACNNALSEMCSGHFSRQFTVQVDGDTIPIGTVLQITDFVRGELNFELLRKQPTLDEALKVLIGACVVCIAVMKPSRENELTHLKRDCLLQSHDGYYLKFTLGKSNSGEAYQVHSRPIPIITAKAIQLLQKLGEGLVNLFSGNLKIKDNLFYLPRQRNLGALQATTDLLNRHLDIFCDYIGLPLDALGRRWYLRIHEMRKWFLLLLFWSGKYDVLDAARWIAGHTDAQHIYAYIEREFPGEELPKLEAEYAVDRLRVLESSGVNNASDGSGINGLYEVVLEHFKVKSLSLVPESEWADYVLALRQSDGFVLEPHSIYAEHSNKERVGINVSFVLREAAK
jgi:hypothetical protein